VPADAPWDVLSYQDIHPAFPAASTLQQLYDDQGVRGLPRARPALRHRAGPRRQRRRAPLRVAPEPGRTVAQARRRAAGDQHRVHRDRLRDRRRGRHRSRWTGRTGSTRSPW
jgi:hypothetical protein